MKQGITDGTTVRQRTSRCVTITPENGGAKYWAAVDFEKEDYQSEERMIGVTLAVPLPGSDKPKRIEIYGEYTWKALVALVEEVQDTLKEEEAQA
jgi:hypothetical protein